MGALVLFFRTDRRHVADEAMHAMRTDEREQARLRLYMVAEPVLAAVEPLARVFSPACDICLCLLSTPLDGCLRGSETR